MKRPTVRFSFASALSAVVLLTASSADAVQSGGQFAAPTQSGKSTVDSPLQKTKRSFNALPFSAAHAASSTVTSDPQTSTLRPPLKLSSPIQGTKPFILTSPQVSKNPKMPPVSSNQLKAQPVGFGTPRQTTSDQFKAKTRVAGQIAKYVDLNNCTVSFIDDIQLPAKESGVIESLLVKEGEFIPAGKVVGKIDDELYRRMMEQAEMRFNMAKEMATDTTSIQAAEKKYRVAGIEAAKTKRLGQTGSKSDSEVMMAVYTKDIALLELEKAQREKDKAYAEARLEAARMSEVQTRIKRHVLQSNFDAYVVEIFKKPQEFVQSGEEVMRIARMDKLWVQGIVNIADLNPSEVVDRPVTVTVDLARGETATFEGKIVYVALERQSLKSYMVKAEIQNRPLGGHWVLQPLSSVQMRIHLDGKAPQNPIGTAANPSVKR